MHTDLITVRGYLYVLITVLYQVLLQNPLTKEARLFLATIHLQHHKIVLDSVR